MRALIFPACIVAVVIGAWNLWQERTQSHPPGVLVQHAPHQRVIASPLELSREKYRLVARAEFDITARVIARMRYRWDDLAPVVPVDLALGWQNMSDSAVLDRMSCNQGQRYYACTWKSHDVIEPRKFTAQSANMHMIPATPEVEKALLRVRKGQIVTVRGMLVDVVMPNGGKWATSLTREDSGPGACEIVLVTEITAS